MSWFIGVKGWRKCQWLSQFRDAGNWPSITGANIYPLVQRVGGWGAKAQSKDPLPSPSFPLTPFPSSPSYAALSRQGCGAAWWLCSSSIKYVPLSLSHFRQRLKATEECEAAPWQTNSRPECFWIPQEWHETYGPIKFPTLEWCCQRPVRLDIQKSR